VKLQYLLAASFVLTACDSSVTELPQVEAPLAAVAQTPKELPLPAFPEYPAPKVQLNADDSGVTYYPIKSPYDFSSIK